VTLHRLHALVFVCAVAMLPALGLGASQARAQKYRLCDSPKTHYLVASVHGARCGHARHVAHAYFWRVLDLRRGSWHHVLGFDCARASTGNYFGLFGSKTHCRRGHARLRAYYRGE
jgi:hypothetical protein